MRPGSGSESARILNLNRPVFISYRPSISRLRNNSNRNELLESLAVAYNQGRAVKLNQVLALKFT